MGDVVAARFAVAYSAAMTKLARYEDDGGSAEWRKDVSDNLERESDAARNAAILLGGASLGSIGIAALAPSTRGCTLPLAVMTGVPATCAALTSVTAAKGKRMYDSDDPTLEGYRRFENSTR